VKVLGLIPARGGSKHVPNKNIRPLAGKSLIQRAFEGAVESGVVDRVILSTDSQQIAEVASDFGLQVPFLRPAELAGDETPMIDVALHALAVLEEDGYTADVLLLLQPTSPFRRPEHIEEAARLIEMGDSVCSVTPLPKAWCPHYTMKITPEGYIDHFMPDGSRYTRRQDVPQAYARDGSIFMTRVTVLRSRRRFYGDRCLPIIIPFEETLNIDEPGDWEEAERRLAVLSR
jgi:CMP-N,N'-diacetyllegionaminic acid synthase